MGAPQAGGAGNMKVGNGCYYGPGPLKSTRRHENSFNPECDIRLMDMRHGRRGGDEVTWDISFP